MQNFSSSVCCLPSTDYSCAWWPSHHLPPLGGQRSRHYRLRRQIAQSVVDCIRTRKFYRDFSPPMTLINQSINQSIHRSNHDIHFWELIESYSLQSTALCLWCEHSWQLVFLNELQCLFTLEGHTEGVWAAEVEGSLLVSGSVDQTVRTWNLEDGTHIATFKGHTSTVRGLALKNGVYVGDKFS